MKNNSRIRIRIKKKLEKLLGNNMKYNYEVARQKPN